MIFTTKEIAKATKGHIRQNGRPGSICTDSRIVTPNTWFLAIVGDRFDGHDFVGQMPPSAGIIGQRVPPGWKSGFIAVPDSLVALQALASAARDRFMGPVVGITGSAGKTTCRALISSALTSLGPVHQTKGNFNNHIGLPLTLLAAPNNATSWVVELGMNAPGEIHLLQSIARPTHRLITNVGAAHLEGLGSISGVARAKQEIFDGAQQGDTIYINIDDPFVRRMPLPEGVQQITWGQSPNANVRLNHWSISGREARTKAIITWQGGTITTNLCSPGEHMATNACAAAAIAQQLGVTEENIASGLAQYVPVGARMKVETGPGGARILNDAYNANPLSMKASLRALEAVHATRKFALLGDMLEMGEGNDHDEVLRFALGLKLTWIGVAGSLFGAAARAIPDPRLHIANDAKELGAYLHGLLGPRDCVLIKGSRGLRMEESLQAMGDVP